MNLSESYVKDILVSKLPHFEARITKINEKLKGSGLPPIQVTNHGTSMRNIDLPNCGVVRLPMATVSVSRNTPTETIGLVQVLAKTDLNLNLGAGMEAATHRTYGELTEVEREMIRNPPNPKACDHCNSNRPRSYIYTLKTPGGLMRVGGGCLKEVVGFDMPRWTSALNEVIDEADKYSEVTFREMEENQIVPLRVFLAIADKLIERDGYRNRDYGLTTGSEAFTLTQAAVSTGAEREDPEDTKTVDDIITYVKTSVHREDAQNDYFVNLRTLVNVGFLTHRQANTLGSAAQSYRNHLKDLARREAERRKQEGTAHIGLNFIGEIKDRKVFEDLVVVYVYADVDPMFGAFTKISLVDPAGNYFSWKASGSIEVELNQTLHVLGTITKHAEYHSKTYGREIKDNKLSRCSFLTPEQVLEAREKAAKAEARALKKLERNTPAP